MSAVKTTQRSRLRRLLCCFKSSEQLQVIDTAALHSIAPPIQPLSPPSPDPLPEGDTLKLTLRSENGERRETLETLLRNISAVEMGDTVREPLYSVSTEMVSVEPNSAQEVESKALPHAEGRQTGRSGSGLPLKAVTPAFFQKRVRIPTAKAKEHRGVKDQQLVICSHNT